MLTLHGSGCCPQLVGGNKGPKLYCAIRMCLELGCPLYQVLRTDKDTSESAMKSVEMAVSAGELPGDLPNLPSPVGGLSCCSLAINCHTSWQADLSCPLLAGGVGTRAAAD
jgi:hypothetical protein